MADIQESLINQASMIRDERNAGANTAERVGSLLVAICQAMTGLDIEELAQTFLRKDTPDRTSYLTTFLAGIVVGSSDKGISVGQDGEVTAKLDNVVVDRLTVNKIAQFIELQLKKLSYVGGEIILSPASMTCIKVEELDEVYRCYMKIEDGTRRIQQEFVAGDLALCQTFNLVSDGTHVSNTYYWRLVTAVGDDYIDLSIEDCDEGSTVPAADDFICLLGNRSDPDRQNAIILSTVGDDAPSIKQYQGIDSFTLQDKSCTVLSPMGNRLIGDFYSSSTSVQTISEQLSQLDTTIGDLQAQSDQEMCIWFYEGEPSMDKAPAADWTDSSLLESHDQDIFYSTDEGRAWRFEVNEGEGTWNEITDKQTLAALEKAASAEKAASENTTSINRNTEQIELLAKNMVTSEATQIETSSGIVTTPTFNGLFTEKKVNGEVISRTDIFTEITEDGQTRSVINGDLINLKGKVTLQDISDDSGNTIIEGGKIKSSLLDVDTILGDTGIFSGSIVTRLKTIGESDAAVLDFTDNTLQCLLYNDLNIMTGSAGDTYNDDLIYQYEINLPYTGERYIGAHVYIVNGCTPPFTRAIGGIRYTAVSTGNNSYFIGISKAGENIYEEEGCNKIEFVNGIIELMGIDGGTVNNGVSVERTIKWCVVRIQCSTSNNITLSD
jgi:hypothetical protein